MTIFTDGYIKFNCQWNNGDFDFSDKDLKVLNEWRAQMYRLNLIGAYPDGIGFGNISTRWNHSLSFIISGSATGNVPDTGKEHYALVTDYNFELNSLSCTGSVKASSESLSHAIIYDRCSHVNGVIHIHHKALWDQLKNKIPTTDEVVEYGTPAMAKEIERVISENDLYQKGIIIMGGHEEGIIAFGDTLETAGNIILEKLNLIR